jgi:hypothetical protein
VTASSFHLVSPPGISARSHAAEEHCVGFSSHAGDGCLSRYLLVAECISAATRERVDPMAVLFALRSVSIVLPPRSLEAEIIEASAHGHLRGADLWHVACALFVADSARTELAFLSRDEAQRKVAGRLGFVTP